MEQTTQLNNDTVNFSVKFDDTVVILRKFTHNSEVKLTQDDDDQLNDGDGHHSDKQLLDCPVEEAAAG